MCAPRLKVRDLMSHSVRTVLPDTLITELADRMLRTGHEGFPVVNAAGQVVGLVTRNSVDRALQHRWQHEPVSRIMEAGEVSVSPFDSVEHVRALMIQKGWGQVPVVDAGTVSGGGDAHRPDPPTTLRNVRASDSNMLCSCGRRSRPPC